jgi:hypothetical protein
MKVLYTGVHDAVEVSDSDGRLYRCERSEPVELPDALAKDLLAQSTWEEPDQKAKPRKRAES